MATLTRPESKKLYSWWWDGHTAPKNSKWLKENLQDMDIKVKAMIKLLEEDADTFAKKAEMYYKKRPELLKLLEEFYRAYRAIAERYDHATGALRQAHRTMAEAFPHQVPFVLPDESPHGEMSPTPHTLFDSNDSQKNTRRLSSPHHGIKRNGGYSDESAALIGHKGFKQLNEILGSGEEATHAMPFEGRTRRILEFPDDEEKALQEEIFQLSNERQNLKSQITSESVRADKSEAEVQSLKDTISKSYSEKEAAASQQQLSLEKISALETEISRSKEDLKTLNDEMSMAVAKLNTGEDRCLVLEKANDTLQMELVSLKQKAEEQLEELCKKQEELVKLSVMLQEEHQGFMQAETARLSLEKLLFQSQEQERLLDLEIQAGNEKLKDTELRRAALEEELRKITEENGSLNDQNLASALKMRDLQDEVEILNEILSKLNSEKETATLQHQLFLQRISALETEISHTEGDLKNLKDEALITAAKLNTNEERCLLVEKANESLQIELDRLKQEVQEKQEELSKKQEDLEKLNLLLQEEHQRLMQAETARLSLEKLLSQSQEQERILDLEIQVGTEKLKDAELRSAALEEELQKITEENGLLNDQNLASALKIRDLQDEVESLNEILSKLNSEKETAALQHQLFLQRISALETEISHTEGDLKNLKDETLIIAAKLNTNEERCLLVEKANESLQMELDRLKQEVQEKQEELNKKQEELEKLNLLLQEEHQGLLQAETARLSLEKLLSQSQEQERLLYLEIQVGTEKLKDAELRSAALEEELQKIKEENGSLNEQCLSSASTIIILQDEISSFNVSNMKLENEASFLRDEKKALQEEFSGLKEDRNELEQSYRQLTEQVEAANFNVKSLQALVKQLQSGNAELKERCNKHENEKIVHLENLKDMGSVSEKKVVLENSLSDANVEIETLREKVKGLEQSCELLCDEISLHLTDKATLVSQVKVVSQDTEKLLERNVFLKNSLSDVNVELEDLREKLKVSEESCQLLSAQNSNLLSEKSTLVSQVEETSQALENLEARFVELEDKHFSLESEKDFALQQVTELRDLLKRDKEEYETLILSIMLSSNSQISTLENQMDLMQEEGRLSEEEFEEEQVQSMSADIEMVVLQRSLREMHEKNSILSLEFQKLLETSKSADKLISQLKKELLIQEKNLDRRSFDVMSDEVALQILSEIKNLRISFSDAQDENQLLRLEKSVVMAILEQFGLDMMDLAMDKFALKRESKTKNEEILMLQSNEIEHLQVIKQLSQDLQASNQKHVLKSDMDIQVVSGLNEEIMLLTENVGAVEVENVCLKEMVSDLYKHRHMMISEIDLNTNGSCEQMSFEIESEKIHVARHDDVLLQANENEDKNTDLRQNLEGLQPDIEVFSLSEDDVQRKHETSCGCQANEILTWELNRLHKEVEDLRSREEELSFELQKEVNEVNCCEAEIAKLLEDVQITTVSAVLFEEKIFELLVACESLEISSMVERERLYEEITASNANVVKLNDKFGIMEEENRDMKEALNSYLLVVENLSDDISSLEEGILSLAERYVSKHQGKQGSELAFHHHRKSTQDPAEYHSPTVPVGILELQKLDAKIKALKEVVTGTGNLLKHETFESTGARSESASQVAELVKAKGHLNHEEKISEGGDAGPSRMKDEQKMKDIPLDLVLSSSQRGSDVRYCGGSTIDIAGSSDISLDSWETPERVEAAEGRRRYPSSERVFEKELSIDKLELPQKFTEPHQEWNGRVTEVLSSDAQRLSVIQKSARELRRNMEASDMCNYPTTFEFDTIKSQLKEADGAISQLIDINGKLKKKAEDITTSTGMVQEPNETQSKHRRQISELTGRSSEKIGRLELELQKIQYIFLKLGEEHDHKKPRGTPGRRVILRDYIYGKMDSRRRRKGRCGCIRPKTSDD